jgi:hypothetical protein
LWGTDWGCLVWRNIRTVNWPLCGHALRKNMKNLREILLGKCVTEFWAQKIWNKNWKDLVNIFTAIGNICMYFLRCRSILLCLYSKEYPETCNCISYNMSWSHKFWERLVCYFLNGSTITYVQFFFLFLRCVCKK